MKKVEIVLMYSPNNPQLNRWGFFTRRTERQNKRLRGGCEEFYRAYIIDEGNQELLKESLRRHIKKLESEGSLPSRNNYPFMFPELTNLLQNNEITQVC